MITNGMSSMDIVLLAVLVGLLLYHIFTQRKIKRDINGIAEKYSYLITVKEGINHNITKLEKGFKGLNKKIEDCIQTLSQKFEGNIKMLEREINGISAKNQALIQEKDESIREIDEKAELLKSSLVELQDRINAYQTDVSRSIKENEGVLKQLAAKFNNFSGKLDKMKDFIRERNIDLDL
jgi:DNA repair exonuclease SbcCD ATPase subunit